MYGKRKPRQKHVQRPTDDAKSIAAQKKYIDLLIDNVRQYFTKLELEHKELTTLQAYLMAKKLQSEQERKTEVPLPQEAEESASINKIKLDLGSKFQFHGSEEEEDEDEDSD